MYERKAVSGCDFHHGFVKGWEVFFCKKRLFFKNILEKN